MLSLLRRLLFGERRHGPRTRDAVDAMRRLTRVERRVSRRVGIPVQRLRDEALQATERLSR